jgi:hypothetical protein
MNHIQLRAASEVEATRIAAVICRLISTNDEEYESYIKITSTPGIYDAYFINKEVKNND